MECDHHLLGLSIFLCLTACFHAVRAGGITIAGLILGAVVGSALQSWLRVDIVPIGVSAHSLLLYIFECRLLAAVHIKHTGETVMMSASADNLAHHFNTCQSRVLDQFVPYFTVSAYCIHCQTQWTYMH